MEGIIPFKQEKLGPGRDKAEKCLLKDCNCIIFGPMASLFRRPRIEALSVRLILCRRRRRVITSAGTSRGVAVSSRECVSVFLRGTSAWLRGFFVARYGETVSASF